MSASKNLKFAERYRLQFRWEAFNVFNHPSYGTPVTTASKSSAGQINGSGAVGARVMQGALKLYF
jgi:phosphoribosylformylglycinamidine (FGAM) synthase-like enzyme